jgi:hypothetical protein
MKIIVEQSVIAPAQALVFTRAKGYGAMQSGMASMLRPREPTPDSSA